MLISKEQIPGNFILPLCLVESCSEGATIVEQTALHEGTDFLKQCAAWVLQRRTSYLRSWLCNFKEVL